MMASKSMNARVTQSPTTGILTEITASGSMTTMPTSRTRANGTSRLNMLQKPAPTTSTLRDNTTNAWATPKMVTQSGLPTMEILRETSISGSTLRTRLS